MLVMKQDQSRRLFINRFRDFSWRLSKLFLLSVLQVWQFTVVTCGD
ncbi:hypothetical protein BZL35_00835 [Candidatus Pandoraea novymonadis]|uniref:Uncharacterized protein n=1 Tax=Candidatus Pandoraea novymonadis TaxID=1808959 RepID=A0ABX5FDS6_9BURK|nr:hypothetical protein BZL35_00835 [Candidatus Pandoraea novymonadis]